MTVVLRLATLAAVLDGWGGLARRRLNDTRIHALSGLVNLAMVWMWGMRIL